MKRHRAHVSELRAETEGRFSQRLRGLDRIAFSLDDTFNGAINRFAKLKHAVVVGRHEAKEDGRGGAHRRDRLRAFEVRKHKSLYHLRASCHAACYLRRSREASAARR